MKTLHKALIGTVAAGAMAVSAASPAFADHSDRNGVNVGEIIAGALIIGGIAAVASSGNRDRGYNDDYRYDRAGYGGYNDGYGNGYDRGYRQGNPRQAVEQCISAAQRGASRYSYGRAQVTDIRDVRNTRYGFEVRGRIAVNGQDRYGRSDDNRYGQDRYGRTGDNRYGQGWGNDYRGWNDNLRGYDSGSFKCKFERGRIVDLDYSGIRGL